MERVAILVDGDNIGAGHAPRIAALGKAEGRVDIYRAYADATNGSGWNGVSGVNLIHAGSGKNAADLLLSIDAMEMAVAGGIDIMLVVSSDSDFTHLSTRLRERGIRVVGVGEAKAPATFRASCTRFERLPPVRATSKDPGPKRAGNATGATQLDRNIRGVIAQNSKHGLGMRLADLNAKMRASFDMKISTRPERTWRAYLSARPTLYDLDPRGPNAHVRFKPDGFGP